MDLGTRIQPRVAGRLQLAGGGDGFDAAEQEDVAGDAGEQIDDGDAEGDGEGVGVAVKIAGDDRRGDGGDLAGEIHHAADAAYGAGRCDQRRQRPTDRGGGCQTADGDADPEE